jgi:hypothetical protein
MEVEGQTKKNKPRKKENIQISLRVKRSRDEATAPIRAERDDQAKRKQIMSYDRTFIPSLRV